MEQNSKEEDIIKKTIKEIEGYFREPDPLITVAAFLAYSNVDSFPADRKFLHNFVNKARRDEKFKKLLGDFAFSKVDIYPFSHFFEEIISSLKLCGFLVNIRSVPRSFKIPEGDGEEVKEKVEQRFSKNKEFIQCIKELGERFGEYVKSYT